jgi:hypothetical protein
MSKLVSSLLIILSLRLVYTVPSSGSDEKSDVPPLKERLFFGGSLGLQLGTITDIQFAPFAGLWVLPPLAVAMGPDYRYFKSPDGETDIYGGSIFMQYLLIRDFNSIFPNAGNMGLFIQVEDECLTLQSKTWKNPPYTSRRFMVNTFLAGAGVSQHLGKKIHLNLTLLWALNEPVYDIYSNPEIRISLLF